MNTLTFLQSVYEMFTSRGFEVIIFGGWAEELQGVNEPRVHKDIDLFLLYDNFSILDAYIQSSSELVEILPKRFPHKRAVMFDGVMIEFFLVTKMNNIFTTNFFSTQVYNWGNSDITKKSSYDDRFGKLSIKILSQNIESNIVKLNRLDLSI